MDGRSVTIGGMTIKIQWDRRNYSCIYVWVEAPSGQMFRIEGEEARHFLDAVKQLAKGL